MRKLFSIGLLITSTLFYNCSNGLTQSGENNLSPAKFDEQIKKLPESPILDVRTPEEFTKGHLQNAKNFDWNGVDFEKQISTLDKTKPVFVYCLSGGRSSSAASKMRSDGFSKIYELDGGIMKWRALNLPETTSNITLGAGMSKQHFDSLLISDKMVLIDFYATWCAPCKRMKPYLDEISTNMANQIIVIRINADDNQTICKELKIEGLPVLQLYKNRNLTWFNVGYIEKEELIKHLQ